MDLNYTYGFNTSIGLGADGGIRGALLEPEWTAVYVRPIFIYRNTDQLDFGFSFGAFQNFNTSTPDLLELRPAQQVNLEWPKLEKWSLKSRLRLEERYLVYADENLSPARDWKIRARYELKFKTQPFDLWFIKKLVVLSSGEYFLPVGREVPELFTDQSRLLLGFGQSLGERMSYEVHFFWLRTKSDFEKEFQTDQYVLRLRLYLRNQRFKFVDED